MTSQNTNITDFYKNLFGNNYYYSENDYYRYDNLNKKRNIIHYNNINMYNINEYKEWLNDFNNLKTDYEYPNVIYKDSLNINDLYVLVKENNNIDDIEWLGIFNNLELANYYQNKLTNVLNIFNPFIENFKLDLLYDDNNIINFKVYSLNKIVNYITDSNNNIIQYNYHIINDHIGIVKYLFTDYNKLYLNDIYTNICINPEDYIRYNYSIQTSIYNKQYCHDNFIQSLDLKEMNKIVNNNLKHIIKKKKIIKEYNYKQHFSIDFIPYNNISLTKFCKIYISINSKIKELKDNLYYYHRNYSDSNKNNIKQRINRMSNEDRYYKQVDEHELEHYEEKIKLLKYFIYELSKN